MKTRTNFKKGSRMSRSPNSLGVLIAILTTLILTGIQVPLQSQVAQYTRPSWWFGGAAAANFNFYRGSTQTLNSDLTVPVTFHSGNGVGLYVAPLVEFHPPETRWGIMLQAGYDSRRGKFKEVINPCNCPADLSSDLSYITLEPSLRLAPFKSDFYLFSGPRVAFNMTKSFTYKQKTNPAYPEQPPVPDIKEDFSSINQTLVSMQIGAGYDISLTSPKRRTQLVLSPFVSFQPYFGQNPRSIETWNVTTLRAGAALKLGRGHKIVPSENNKISTAANNTIITPEKAAVVVVNSNVRFSVNSPKNIAVDRRVRETFPLRNYIFFNLGSTEIPDRYVMLRKDQVKDFKEDQLEVFTPKNFSGRSKREMIVYYNIINILGDRMGKNPSITINLVGSSEKGPNDGREMAESVKTYLVDVFGINASRINTEGRDKPKIPSEQPGGTKELTLLREGDRRVSIESSSPILLMEFQSGPDAPLKPVEFVGVQEAPINSYISFNNEGAKGQFSSWSLEIKDDAGIMQHFGPYTQEKVSIPGKAILGSKPEGNYKVTMIGQMNDGSSIRKDTTVHMVLWTPPKSEEMMRFSIIYEFNDSKAINIYERYLTDIVVPKIPEGGKVIMSGFTDIIGDADNNEKLSLARANDVKNIIEKGLAKAGRTDVKLEVYGFGEDLDYSPFDNKFPEERFYNRTVIIDIIPKE